MSKNSKNIIRPDNLAGETGLLAAVILQALRDLKSGNKAARQSARRYFAGNLYRHHLESLGLQADLLPVQAAGELKKMKTKIRNRRDAGEMLDGVIKLAAEKWGVSYAQAFDKLRNERPALFAKYQSVEQAPAGQVQREIADVMRRGRIFRAIEELRQRRPSLERAKWNEVVAFVLENPSTVDLDEADLNWLRQGVKEAEAQRLVELEKLVRNSLA